MKRATVSRQTCDLALLGKLYGTRCTACRTHCPPRELVNGVCPTCREWRETADEHVDNVAMGRAP